jgi:MFS family permease
MISITATAGAPHVILPPTLSLLSASFRILHNERCCQHQHSPEDDRRKLLVLTSRRLYASSTNDGSESNVKRDGRVSSPSSSSSKTTSTLAEATASSDDSRIPTPLLYRYLQVESFTNLELQDVFDRIIQCKDDNGSMESTQHQQQTQPQEQQTLHHHHHHHHDAIISDGTTNSEKRMTESHLRAFMATRIRQLEAERSGGGSIPYCIVNSSSLDDTSSDDNVNLQQQRRDFGAYEAHRIWQELNGTSTSFTTVIATLDTVTAGHHATSINHNSDDIGLSQQDFIHRIQHIASKVDLQRTWPITISMLLVGTSVGVMSPAMPFIVQELALSTTEYGAIVSAFALAKMMCNIPAAILVERHGRKPYMVYSFLIISTGVAGIGLATNFPQLYVCRLLTGAGVSFLSCAGTLMAADVSTPLNRASTMAPIMSAFAAGTALGPAMGGFLVDSVGLHPTFYIVGVSFLCLGTLNNFIIRETKASTPTFPWQHQQREQQHDHDNNSEAISRGDQDSLSMALEKAVGSWGPLLQDATVRNILFMNGMYWVALAGSQMTLLPLILTDPTGLSMTATQVGQVYMGMSMVQIVGNPIFAKIMDRIGNKAASIACGCALISASMATLPLCTNGDDWTSLALCLGLWGTGSSMLSTAPLALISDKVPEDRRAQAIALLRTCGDVGFLLGASATGVFADWAGSLEMAMQSSASLLFTATVYFAARQALNARLIQEARQSTSSSTDKKL